ncbi:hypothetical protein HQ585_10310 [candidate division KSB1 bacterium]|nr:hypothetical protein [candidate division KSB1 bacterium]
MEEVYPSNHFKGFTVHYVDSDGNAYLSRYNQIYLINPEGRITYFASVPFTKPHHRLLKISIAERLMRSNISHILPLKNGTVLVFFNHRIFIVSQNGVQSEYYIATCRRPVNVYYNDESGRILWGDYLAGHKNTINIYESQDFGSSWNILHTFPSGMIRHVHNIVFDKYNKHFWILTGDSDRESGIWKTKDFSKINPFLTGSQNYRAMSIIPTEKGIVIPTDTEYQQNYIQYFSYETSRLERIHKLDGSAFFAQKVNNKFLISTVSEPSKINTTEHADLWIRNDGGQWNRILHLKGDILAGKYFRYPSIKIPSYSDNYAKDFVYISTRSIRGGTYTIRIKI